jgi:hypothetical protein
MTKVSSVHRLQSNSQRVRIRKYARSLPVPTCTLPVANEVTFMNNWFVRWLSCEIEAPHGNEATLLTLDKDLECPFSGQASYPILLET